MRSFNKEIKGIKNDYKYLQEGNYTNLYIIDKLLDLEFDEEGEMEFLNNYIKNKKNYRMLFKENNKINVLKRQIDLYNKTLKKNDKKIEELRNKEKQKRYQELILLIGQKEKEIDEINQKASELNYNIFENETKLKYYNLKAKQYNNDISKIEKKLKEETINIDDNEEEIKYYKERKEILKKNMKKLDEKSKKKEIEKKDMNDEENYIDKELEQIMSILK
jgi:chromosome segregation ATPase